MSDDPLLTDRSGLPLPSGVRVVLDSTLRLPVESKLVESTRAICSWQRRRHRQTGVALLENKGVEVKIFDGPEVTSIFAMWWPCWVRANIFRRCSKPAAKSNWAALEAGAVDKVFLYYAPKILGGLGSRSPWLAAPDVCGASMRSVLSARSCTRFRLMNSPWKLTSERTISRVHRDCRRGWPRPGRAAFSIHCSRVLSDLTLGASIAVNSVCLTAVDIRPDGFSTDLAAETARPNESRRSAARRSVNLERPVTMQTRLSGHIVQGHGWRRRAGIVRWQRTHRARSANLERFLVYKGSICIDGISLTVASVTGSLLRVAIIPHTIEATNLGSRKPGDRLNIECDILAKHVDKLLSYVQISDSAR